MATTQILSGRVSQLKACYRFHVCESAWLWLSQRDINFIIRPDLNFCSDLLVEPKM